MKQETTLKEDETLDYCLSKIGNLIIFVFKKFNLKTHIECEFVSEECERFNMIFRTENYNNEQQERSYSDEDMKSFGDWCRNGLLNTEYGFEKLDEHLEKWKQFKKK